jgi:HSP20 family protein
MARLMEGLFSQAFPPVDIIDRNDELRVYAELPRVRKEDLSVIASDTVLTIKGVIRHEPVEGDYIRQELRHGCFARTLELPVEVNSSTGKAKFQDDRLELTLTKSTKDVTLKIE